MKRVVFIDTEVGVDDKKVHDYGAINESEEKFHSNSAAEFYDFISDFDYLCGHNIVNHDSQYIQIPTSVQLIDTLYLSPLMFPDKPYHKLLKDDKIQSDELNNPLNDAVNSFQESDDETESAVILPEIYFKRK